MIQGCEYYWNLNSSSEGGVIYIYITDICVFDGLITVLHRSSLYVGRILVSGRI